MHILNLSFVMVEVMYCLGYKIKFFSGFNIVAKASVKRILFNCYFDYKHFT